jgi:hypothetical protein
MKTFKSIILCYFFIMASSSIYAQQSPREIGMLVNNGNGLDLVTIRKKSDDLYKRFRLNQVFLDFDFRDDRLAQLSAILSLGWGKLHVKPLYHKVKFVHGPEWGVGTSIQTSDNSIKREYSGNISPYFGYVVGASYRPIPQLHLMLEIMPTATLNYTYNSRTQYSDLDFYSSLFSTNNMALSAYYTFSSGE